MNNNTKRTLINQAPKLFTTQFRRGQTPLGSSGASLPGYTTAASWITDLSESVYKYNPAGSGLKSTQQLNVDWSKFENHTFFNSAQVKTNVAFQKIFDEFPFDGTREKIENFLAGLTGFEKYVYDLVPKEKHYQFFSGSVPTEAHGGTYIITNDASGVQYPELSTNKDALPAIDPGTNSLTIEAHLYPVDDLQPLEYLVDKFNSVNNIGFYISLEQTTPGQKDIKFSVTSGSLTKEVTGTVPTDTWSHFAFVWDRTPYMNKIMFYLNGELQGDSENVIELGPIFSGADLIIGTGFQDLGANIPSFSGSLDEFRIWHVPRNEEDLLNYMQKSVFPNGDLKLYYKFNEPSTVDTPVVIDSSLSSLHGKLSATGMALGIRNNPIYETIVGESPMVYEDLKYAPVLFPQYYKNQDLMNELLAAAKIYDGANPNLITKLIPKHYLLEGQYYDGYSTLQGDIVNSLVSGKDPRSARLGGTQALLMLLYTWAKFFDEMKLYIQAFSDLDFVDYNLTDTVPDDFLLAFAKRNGIALPPLFQGATIEQFVDGENIQDNISTNDMPLKQVQNLIWRRILINMRDFMTSKGTMHSVKSFIRSIGVDPDNNFRIREYGGPSKSTLEFSRDRRSRTVPMLSFANGGFFYSPFLISNRIEPGWPEEDLSGGPNVRNDYITSGSWTYEGMYKCEYNPIFNTVVSKSLVQLVGDDDALFANIVITSGNRVNLYFQNDDTGPVHHLYLDGPEMTDGSIWNVSFGIIRNDDPTSPISSSVSSSLFLRAAKNENGEISEMYETMSFCDTSTNNLLAVQSIHNTGGVFFTIGENVYDGSSPKLLNDSTHPDFSDYTFSEFDGRVSHMRFYSKYVTQEEWKEHVRNFNSVGVLDPKTNWNFDTVTSGSWNRLRFDISISQPDLIADSAGDIEFIDFAQNYNDDINNRAFGEGFPPNEDVTIPQKIFYSYISPKYDSGATINKVRIRSLHDITPSVEEPWVQPAPVYEIPVNEINTDNERFSIDFSVVDALDQDIMTIFGTLKELDNAIGDPNLLYSQDYPSLEVLRKAYFNKLTDKINLKGFFEFFKWFDTNIGTFVAQLLPRKTRFTGVNYVIEPHALERSKIQYFSEDQYLTESDRSIYKTVMLLQLIQGEFSRY